MMHIYFNRSVIEILLNERLYRVNVRYDIKLIIFSFVVVKNRKTGFFNRFLLKLLLIKCVFNTVTDDRLFF